MAYYLTKMYEAIAAVGSAEEEDFKIVIGPKAQKVDDLKSETCEMELQCRKQEKQIQDLNTKCSEQETKIKDLEAMCSQQNEKIQAQRSQPQDNDHKRDHLVAKCSKQRKQIKELKNELKEARIKAKQQEMIKEELLKIVQDLVKSQEDLSMQIQNCLDSKNGNSE